MRQIPDSFCWALESLVSADEFERMTQMLLSAQEDERQKIASDLHDEIGKCLSSVQFAIGGLMQQLEDRMTAAEVEICSNLSDRISTACDGVRRICMGLRPPMLDDLGVVSAIDWFCSGLRQPLIGVDIVQDIRANEDDIPRAVKVAIFRILQEAVGNACKHASPHRLTVLLETDAEGISLEVSDDGVGFDFLPARRARSGIGLASMRERAAMSGGRLTIWSQEGTGTRVLAKWDRQEA